MADIRTKSEEREYLSRLIADWNASRLDIFAINEPTEDLEYRGVMRFFFQDSGSKVATKCVRFTNRDSTDEVTKILVEKFHPDMKMLSNPTYSLYEVHPNGEARKIRMDEYPLRIQLEWQLNDREGRFLLKSDHDKIVHSNLFDVKSSDMTPKGQNLKRRLSKREKKQLKKQREEAKKAAEKSGKDDTQIAQHLYDEMPETSFTRSISNPEAVMRRRRQQKLEKRLKDFQSKDSPAGGTLKIFATTLKPEIPYKTLLVSVDDTTTHVIKEALIKYQMEKEDPEEYCLIMVNIPPDGANSSATLGKERVVHDEDCPLKIAVTWPSNRGTVVFHLRRRANLPQHRRDKRRSKSPVRKPMDLTPDKMVGERLGKPSYPDHLLPYLQELSSDGNDLDFKPRIHRLQMNATEVGSEKTFSSGGNDLQLHAPHILPRHCVITNMDGRVSVTPSSGDAEVSVNGKRIYETTQLQHGDVVKIGRMHTFRFCDPAYEKLYRHSAPPGDTESISSNSDTDIKRKQRPQSLGSTLPSHHSNSYPSNNYPSNNYSSNNYSSNSIDDHVDVDTNEQPEGMFETTFDVSGEVKTYTGGHEAEPYTYSRIPDSPTKTSFGNEDMYDDKLPATLEFRENGEDAFFAAVISEVNGLAVHFKLAPTYTLYMCSRYRMSPHYRPDLMEHQLGERLGVTILKIANMARSTIRENAEMPGSLAFWMANCSEVLHFVKQDIDISPYTKDGQQVLAQSVQLAFRHLVLCVQHELRTTMSAFLDPTEEADMEESDLDSMNDSDNDHVGMPSDGRSFRVQNRYGPDGRPLSGGDSWFGGRRVHGRATVSEVIYNLSSTMSLLRRCRVNAALTIQVFSQLFHFINMWLFNKLVLEPKLGLCTREWGKRISKRLARVEKWAEKQGLELAADCHLCRIAQAAHLLQAPKNTSADINAISSSCFKLNSLQMRALLENYRPAPDEYIPQDYIERMVATAEEKADEVARSNGQEIQREEETELLLPFLLPEDGYSCDVIRGVPPGLQGFLEPLANTGLCRLTIQPETSGLWTVYQRKHRELGVDVPGNITPDIQEVSFNKGRGGMGLSIVAAKGIRQDKLGIYIKQVVKDGPASKDGRLQAGDQILSVNGESLVGATQEKAAEIMVKSGAIVTLQVVKQGAIYHGLATLLIQTPNKETLQRLTPVEPEPEPMQLSPTLPDNDIHSSGRWLPDNYAYSNNSSSQREDEESMREESWRQKEENNVRGTKEEEERLFEERMRREDEERMRREDEERLRREDAERLRREDEERMREEKERMRQEEEERARREEEDRFYEEKHRKEEEEKLYEEKRKQEEEDRRLGEMRQRESLRIRQEKQEEERRKREEQEDEKFRIQEDRIRKRMEEERRVIEEERRKLAEERRLLEEERKMEAERKRTEEQRLLEEERRLAEEKKLIEEERRRVLNQKTAEEDRSIDEENRRLEDERMAVMQQRRRAEQEREMAEEQRRREEIRMREEYRRMEDQRRLAEERKRSEEEERLRPHENKQPRTRKIRFEDEVVAAANAPKVETVQLIRSSPQPGNEMKATVVEREIIKPTIRSSVEAEKQEISPVNKTPTDEYFGEEPSVVRGRLTDEDMSSMDAIFEKLEEVKAPSRPNTLSYSDRPIKSEEPTAEEPPTSPIRVDSRDTRYGRAIVIKQGMLPSARSPSSQNKTNFDYESVAQNLKAIDQSRKQNQQEGNEDDFERWQKKQRELAEQREREAEERRRQNKEQDEKWQREQEQREREQREQREQREREQREGEQREREQREQREREQREQREREQREQREREQREQHEREQREREQEQREQKEQREREQREQLERQERDRKEREDRERQDREQRARLEREKKEREELERQQRLERERLERERKEFSERQRKEREEREKAERELKRQREEQQALDEKKQQQEQNRLRLEAEQEKNRIIERERKMLYPGSKGSTETLDYIESMTEDEVDREFKRRLEAEKKRHQFDGDSYEDRRAGGLVSVTRVTYHHPDRDDQMERDRKVQLVIQERRQLDKERKESERRNIFEGEREKQKAFQRRQQEENEREQEDWLNQQREKHEQARREQGRFRLDKKSQEDEDMIKKRTELQQRREQDDLIRMNIQRQRDDAERKMDEEHKQARMDQELELERKLEEQSILIEKENEARKQLQDEQRSRFARGSTSEPDHVIELKERALKDYERRRLLIDQEINRQRADSRYQEQLRQTEIEDVKAKFDQQKPVSALKTSNGTKPKKQVSFSHMSTEFREPSSPTYVVGSSSGYTAKITPAASVRLVQTRPPADLDSPPIPRPPLPDDDDYDDYDPPPLPPPPPPEELLDDNHFPPPPRSMFSDRSSSSSSMSSSDPRSTLDSNSRDYSDVFPADYPYPANNAQYKNSVSNYGTYPRAARPMSYPTPADLDNLQFNDSVRYSGSNNNISGFNSVSGLRETQSLGRINNAESSAVEANRNRMGRISLTDDPRKVPPPVAKKPESLEFKDKMKMFNQDGTPKSRVTVSRWQRDQVDVNGDVSYT